MKDLSDSLSEGDSIRQLVRKRASSPRKSERTRRAILDAALDFLWTHPFRDLTVAELASRTKTSRATFYQYFADLHDLMDVLLSEMGNDILVAATPWFEGNGDPASLLRESLSGLVKICYQRGPILRAVADATASDETLEKNWGKFLQRFDDAVTERIEQQQAAGLIPPFAARSVAVALNRLDASLMIETFGRRPRGNQDQVLESLVRIWISTLYVAQALQQPVASPQKRKIKKKSVSQNKGE